MAQDGVFILDMYSSGLQDNHFKWHPERNYEIAASWPCKGVYNAWLEFVSFIQQHQWFTHLYLPGLIFQSGPGSQDGVWSWLHVLWYIVSWHTLLMMIWLSIIYSSENIKHLLWNHIWAELVSIVLRSRLLYLFKQWYITLSTDPVGSQRPPPTADGCQKCSIPARGTSSHTVFQVRDLLYKVRDLLYTAIA